MRQTPPITSLLTPPLYRHHSFRSSCAPHLSCRIESRSNTQLALTYASCRQLIHNNPYNPCYTHSCAVAFAFALCLCAVRTTRSPVSALSCGITLRLSRSRCSPQCLAPSWKGGAPSRSLARHTSRPGCSRAKAAEHVLAPRCPLRGGVSWRRRPRARGRQPCARSRPPCTAARAASASTSTCGRSSRRRPRGTAAHWAPR